MIETFWELCARYELRSRDQMLREAIRVVKLKLALAKMSTPDCEFLEQSPELLFTRMQDIVGSIELGHFPGDRELFFQLYHAGKDLDLLEYGLQTLRQDRAIGAMQVHEGIFARFLSEAVGDGTSRILVAEAEKFLEGLSAYRNQPKSSLQLTLLTENYLLGRLLHLVFDDCEGIQVIQGSLYHPLPLNEKFQAILTVPVFGAKLEDDTLRYRDSELAAIHHLAPSLSGGGTLAAVLPARIMFQSGEMETWRRSIEEDLPVRALYTLPEGLFRPYTAIKTYLLLLGGGEISKEVRIGQLAVEHDRLVDRQTVGLSHAAFHELKDWRIELMLEQDGSTLAAFQQSAVPKIKLKAAADIFRGKSILKQDLRPGNVSVLNISNLDGGEVWLDQLETIDEEERKLKRYQVQEGDLVLTCRGTQTKLALFPASDSFVIASANIIVIRFNERVDSLYAKIFLESPVGLALIQSFQRGTTVMNLNPSDVGEIEIPLLSIQRQHEIGEQYRREKQRYREAVNEATVRWEQQKSELYEAVLIDPHKEDKRLYGNS